MCFLIEFILFLDKCIAIEKISIIYYVLSHSIFWRNRFSLKTWLWVQLALTGKIPTIYYVLSHSIFWQAHWENLYHLLCAFSSNQVLRRAHCHWEILYYFVCAFSSCSSASALSLRKSLLFSEYFLSYRCSRLDIDSDHDRCQSHFLRHWENLYHLVDAFSSYFLMSALRKLLSFNRCFFIIFFDERIEKR